MALDYDQRQGDREHKTQRVDQGRYDGPVLRAAPDVTKRVEAFLSVNPSPVAASRFLSRLREEGLSPAEWRRVTGVLQRQRGNAFTAQVVSHLEKSNEKKGWLDRMKGWFKETAGKVKEGYDQAVEKTGELLHEAGRVYKEAKEFLGSTSVSMEGDEVTFATDLDEAMDLLPAKTRKMLNLDGSERDANEVKFVWDGATEKLTVTSPKLVLNGIQNKGLTTGPATLEGVTIELGDPQALLPLLGKKLGSLLPKGTGKDFEAKVTVTRITASDVKFQSDKGPVLVQEIVITDLDADAVNPGGGLPFVDKAPDQISATFGLGNAHLSGVTMPDGAKVDELDADEFAMTMDQKRETATIGVQGIESKGVELSGGKHIEEARLEDLAAKIDNQGGGLVFFDDRADHILASVTVGNTRITDLDLENGAGLDEAHAQDVKLKIDQDERTRQVKAGEIGASGIHGPEGQRVDEVAATGVSAQLGPKDLAAKVATLHAEGIDTEQVDVASLDAKGLAGSKKGKALEGSVRSLRAEGIDTERADVASLDVKGLAGSKKGKALEGSVRSLRAEGIDTEQVDVASLDVKGLAGSKKGKAVQGTAESLKVEGVDSEMARVASLQATGLSGKKKGDVLQGTAESLKVKGVDTDRVDVKSLEAMGLEGKKKGEAIEAAVGELHAKGVDTDRVDVKSLDAMGLEGKKKGEAIEAAVAELHAKGVDSDKVDLKAADVTKLRAAIAGDRKHIQAKDLHAEGLVTDKAKVASADLSGLGADMAGGDIEAKLAKLKATGVDTDQVDLESVSGRGLQAKVGGGEVDALAESLAAKGIDAKGVQVASGKLTGAHVHRSGEETSVDLQSGVVKGVKKDDLSVGSAAASGVHGKVSPGTMDVSADQVEAAKIKAAMGKNRLSVDKAEASDLWAWQGKGQVADHVRAEVGHAHAEGIGFQGQVGQKKSGKGGKGAGKDAVDMVAQGMKLVKDVDAHGAMPLNRGKYPGGVKVEAGTVAQLDLVVENGRIDPSQTRLRFNKALHAALWVKAHGAYLNDRGEVRLNLSGWADMNIADKIRGDGKKTIPLSMNELSDLIRAMPSRAKPKKGKGDKDMGKMYDLDAAKGKAVVGLGPGKISNRQMSVELGEARTQATNRVTVEKQQGQALVASFVEFLLKSFNVKVGGADLSSGQALAKGMKLEMRPGKKGAQVSGKLGSLDMDDIGLRK